MAVGLQDENDGLGFIDPSVFEIRVALTIKNSETEYNILEKNIEIHECSESDFDNPQIFEELLLKNNYCLNKNESLFMEGYWDEANMSYLKVELNLCDNSTFHNQCKTHEEIEEIMKTKNSFNLYITDSVIDIYDYNNPIKQTIINEYKSADYYSKKIIEYFIKNVQVKTDDGIFVQKEQTLKEIKYDDQKIDFYSKKSHDIDKTLFRYEIYASKKLLMFDRRYQKLLDLLGYLGGIFVALKIIGAFFVSIEFNFIIKKKIINLLFKLPEDSPFGNTKKESILQINKKKSNSENGFLFSIFEYIILHLKKLSKKNFTLKEKYFLRGEEKFNEKIELTQILKKLQEIKFIKKIFLNQDQLKLFKHFKKPFLTLNENSRKKIDKWVATKSIWKGFESRRDEKQLNETDLKILDIIDPRIIEKPKTLEEHLEGQYGLSKHRRGKKIFAKKMLISGND